MYECNPSHTRRMDQGYLTHSINSSQDKNNHIDGGKIKLTHSEQQFNEYFANKMAKSSQITSLKSQIPKGNHDTGNTVRRVV